MGCQARGELGGKRKDGEAKRDLRVSEEIMSKIPPGAVLIEFINTHSWHQQRRQGLGKAWEESLVDVSPWTVGGGVLFSLIS
jgi:hypothetical protein